jgi:hypothetical protein
MHVLIYPRGKDGKKLRLSKNDLRKIHNEWDNFLKQEGYNIKKNGNNVKKSIWQYMREKTEEMGYLPIPSFIIDEEMINEGKKRFLKKLRDTEIRDTEISLFEDIIEKEAIKVAENRLIRKMIKTKEYLYKPLEKPLGKSLDNPENLNDNLNNRRMKF